MKKFLATYASIALMFVAFFVVKDWPINTSEDWWFLCRVALYWPLVLLFMLAEMFYGW